jgi:uncharacterized protein (DUF927 family)
MAAVVRIRAVLFATGQYRLTTPVDRSVCSAVRTGFDLELVWPGVPALLDTRSRALDA